MQITEQMAMFTFLGIVAFVILVFFLEKAINKRKPQVSIEVIVIKVNDRYSGSITFGRRGGYNLNPRYQVTFKLKSGKKKTFSCPSPKYKWICKGDVGILTHQGTRFISFEVID